MAATDDVVKPMIDNKGPCRSQLGGSRISTSTNTATTATTATQGGQSFPVGTNVVGPTVREPATSSPPDRSRLVPKDDACITAHPPLNNNNRDVAPSSCSSPVHHQRSASRQLLSPTSSPPPTWSSWQTVTAKQRFKWAYYSPRKISSSVLPCEARLRADDDDGGGGDAVHDEDIGATIGGTRKQATTTAPVGATVVVADGREDEIMMMMAAVVAAPPSANNAAAVTTGADTAASSTTTCCADAPARPSNKSPCLSCTTHADGNRRGWKDVSPANVLKLTPAEQRRNHLRMASIRRSSTTERLAMEMDAAIRSRQADRERALKEKIYRDGFWHGVGFGLGTVAVSWGVTAIFGAWGRRR